MTGSRAGWNTEYVNLAPLGFQNRHSKIFNTIVLFVDQKKHLKTKVNQLLRRASTTSAVPEAKRMNGLEMVSLPTLRLQQALRSHPPNDDFIRTPQQEEDAKKSMSKTDSFRRWSEVKSRLPNGQGAASRS